MGDGLAKGTKCFYRTRDGSAQKNDQDKRGDVLHTYAEHARTNRGVYHRTGSEKQRTGHIWAVPAAAASGGPTPSSGHAMYPDLSLSLSLSEGASPARAAHRTGRPSVQRLLFRILLRRGLHVRRVVVCGREPGPQRLHLRF